MHLKTPDAYQVKLEEGVPPIRLYRNGEMISGEAKGGKERRCNIDVDTGDLVSSDGKKVLAKGVIPKEYLKDIKEYLKDVGNLDPKDIKTAKSLARKLAMIYHPDKNPGDAKAEEMFKILGGWDSREEKPEHFSSFNKGSGKEEEPKKEAPKNEEPKTDSKQKEVSVDVDPNNAGKKDPDKTKDVSVDVDTSSPTDNKDSDKGTAVANPEDVKKTEVDTNEDKETTADKKDGESVESATGAEPDEEDNEDEIGLPAPEDTTQSKTEGGKESGTPDAEQAKLDPELSKQITALVAKMSTSPNPDQAFFAEMDTLLHLLTSYVSGGAASGDKPETKQE